MKFYVEIEQKYHLYFWIVLLSVISYAAGLITMHTVMKKEGEDVAVSLAEYMLRAGLLTSFSFVFTVVMNSLVEYFSVDKKVV